MKIFFKKHWPDILFLLIVCCLIRLFFVPIFSVVTKDADKVKTFYEISLFDVLHGSKINNSIFEPNYLLISVSVLFFAGAILFYISFIGETKEKKISNVLYYLSAIFNFLMFFSVLFMYVLLPLTSKGIENVPNFNKVEVVSWSYGLYLFLEAVSILIVLSKIFERKKFTVYEISEIAVLVALALVLDKVKIPVGITGGSINLSAVPLILLSIRHGFFKGLISSSLIFGLISCLLDGYGIQTFPFDYLIAFSGYATVGFFMYLFKKFVIKNRENIEFASMVISIVLCGIVSFLTRMTGSSISSMLFYELGLKEALIYNIAYIPLSVFGSTLIAILLAKPLQIINHKFPLKVKKEN